MQVFGTHTIIESINGREDKGVEQQQLPLLEYDTNKVAKMMPEHFVHLPKNLPPKCVLAFSHTSVEKIAANAPPSYEIEADKDVATCIAAHVLDRSFIVEMT